MESKFEFGITRVKLDAYYSMRKAHAHSFYEIYYLLSGSRRFLIEEDLYEIQRGDALLIAQGAMHRNMYLRDKTHERYIIKFTENFVKPLMDQFGSATVLECFQNPHVTVPLSRREYIECLLHKMEQEYRLSDEFSIFLLRNHLYELLIFLVRCHKYQYETIELSATDEVIKEVAQYISKHYEETISLEDMAKKANMSATYFSRKFKRATGYGFKEYLTNVRIRASEELLLGSKHSITEIALRCGFNDSNYFGDVFKKTKGISPHQYRKNKGIV